MQQAVVFGIWYDERVNSLKMDYFVEITFLFCAHLQRRSAHHHNDVFCVRLMLCYVRIAKDKITSIRRTIGRLRQIYTTVICQRAAQQSTSSDGGHTTWRRIAIAAPSDGLICIQCEWVSWDDLSYEIIYVAHTQVSPRDGRDVRRARLCRIIPWSMNEYKYIINILVRCVNVSKLVIGNSKCFERKSL